MGGEKEPEQYSWDPGRGETDSKLFPHGVLRDE